MNTLKLDIKELEIDDKQNEISVRDYDRYFDYNETFKTNIIVPNSLYKTIQFSEVTSPFALVVVSDKRINVKVNGFEITNTKMVLLNTSISSLEVANAEEVANIDLLGANISIYIWGKQE